MFILNEEILFFENNKYIKYFSFIFHIQIISILQYYAQVLLTTNTKSLNYYSVNFIGIVKVLLF
jgi:hypothetical protein